MEISILKTEKSIPMHTHCICVCVCVVWIFSSSFLLIRVNWTIFVYIQHSIYEMSVARWSRVSSFFMSYFFLLTFLPLWCHISLWNHQNSEATTIVWTKKCNNLYTKWKWCSLCGTWKKKIHLKNAIINNHMVNLIARKKREKKNTHIFVTMTEFYFEIESFQEKKKICFIPTSNIEIYPNDQLLCLAHIFFSLFSSFSILLLSFNTGCSR